MNQPLFDTFVDFWQYWLGTSLEGTETLNLLALSSTIFFIYFVIIYPLVRLAKGGKK